MVIQDYIKKRFIVIFIALAAFIVLICLAVYLESNRSDGYEQQAKSVALGKAADECLSEGLSGTVCNKLSAEVASTECGKDPCWIVQVDSEDSTIFSSSLEVVEKNGKFLVQYYGRNSVEKDAN